jgi:hypothetical protein
MSRQRPAVRHALSVAPVFGEADRDGGIGRCCEGQGHVVRLDLGQPSGPPRRRKPGSDREVLKLPNRVHGAFPDPASRASVAARRTIAATEAGENMRDDPCQRDHADQIRIADHRSQGPRHEGVSAPVGKGSERRQGGRNPLKRARDLRLGAGFTDSRQRDSSIAGLNCAGSSGPGAGCTARMLVPCAGSDPLTLPDVTATQTHAHRAPVVTPISTHHLLHQRPPPRCSDVGAPSEQSVEGAAKSASNFVQCAVPLPLRGDGPCIA